MIFYAGQVCASEQPSPTANADYIADRDWLAWSAWSEFTLAAAPVTEVVYDYNRLGQLKSVGTPTSPTRFASYTYNADGGLKEEQLNNGNSAFKTTYTYNPYRGRLTSFGSAYFSQSIGYDQFADGTPAYLNGNIAQTTFSYDSRLSSLNNAYAVIRYDRLGRLTSAVSATNAAYHVGVSPALSYDPNGNVLTLQRGTTSAVSYNYVANTNKIATVGANAYQHDLNGNLTLSPKASLTYDPFTQMTTELVPPTGGAVKLHYNAADERVLKTQGNQATLYLHGLSDYPLVEKSDNGGSFFETRYVYGLGGLIAMQRLEWTGGTGGGTATIPESLELSAYQPNATARQTVRLLPGFSTVDANGQSRPFQTSVVGGTTAPPVVSGESVVITTRSDYELGASGNLLATYDDGALQASRYETGYGYITASGARFYYHRDHLGNIRAVSDASGRAVRWTDYFAYGAIRDEWSIHTGRDNYGFVGKERDAETNSSDFGARTLLHGVDMWSSVDPLIVKYPDYSPYVYAGNNPLRFVDLNGMDWYQFTDKDGNISTIWRKGDAKTIEHKGVTYNNIGANYNMVVGVETYTFEQQNMVSMETILLTEEAWEQQPAGSVLCYRYSLKMSDKTGNTYDPKEPDGYKTGIQVGKEDKAGIVSATDRHGEGINYVNKLIDIGVAPVVGVDHSPGKDRNDKTTDHYVVIASRKIHFPSGEVSYRYLDPGTAKGKDPNRVFTRDNTGLFTGPGFSNKTYTLTHIVISGKLKP